MKTKYALIIGRWQIFHKGHQGLLQAALEAGDKVMVVIGSAFRSRDPRNPFTWEERKAMIEATLSAEDRARVEFLPVRDYYDDARWNAAVHAGVAARMTSSDSIVLVGHKKDKSSYYLDHFPGWRTLEIVLVDSIDATSLRNVFFGSECLASAFAVMRPFISEEVMHFLEAWSRLAVYGWVREQCRLVAEYRLEYTAPCYLTADSVVTANGHVLLIRRGGKIGNGLWALPGGFVDSGEQFYAAAVRELREETGFSPLASTLRGALLSQAVFDHPLRSPRARLVTTAFHFDFGDRECPEVKANDDAAEVKWVPIVDLPSIETKLFEDHSAVIDHFVGLFPKI